MEGSSVGQYRIIRKIGEGGMGTVWVGEHALLGRRAAIKVLLPEFTSREEIVQRFFNEARAVTAIADPGIVQVFDFGYAESSAYIVMELLEGEAMDARLRRIGRFEPLTAIRLMTQVATSLGAAHVKGVIHRDLKPENIFIVGDQAVTGGERTKILDFGIAKLAGDETSKVKTRTGMVMGTPVYMSPEQCRGAASIDARSDIYTLGCVLFTMLCGRPPFESDSTGDLIIMHVRDAHPPPSSFVPTLPPEVDALIARCLEKDPARRFQSTGEFVAALVAAEGTLLGIPPGAVGPGSYSSHFTPAGALAYRQQPTPAPPDAHTRMAGAPYGTGPQLGTGPQQHGTQPRTTPTTLSASAGSGTVPPTRKKGALYAGLVVAVLAIGGGVFAIVATRSDKGGTPAAAPTPEQPAIAPADAPTLAVETPATPPDAGVADAQAPATEVVVTPDAGVTETAAKTPRDERKKRDRDKRRPPKDGGSKQGGSNGNTSSSGTVDRGD
jgi:serine/threonine-protein kinase